MKGPVPTGASQFSLAMPALPLLLMPNQTQELEVTFTPRSEAEVSGTLKTFVGAQVIASDERRFRFNWTYRGLRLALSGFVQLPPQDKSKEAK